MRRLRPRLTLLTLAVGLAAAAFPGVAAADCEPVLPTSAVTPGMTGTGWTVASGRTKEPFDVEVLGVLPNAIAPGRDLIVVEATSPAIASAGGIWAGMSGSPVYIGGQFAGALAYGLTFGPSTIAGLTPAADIEALVNLPATAAIRRLDRAPSSLRLPPALAQTVAGRAGVSSQAASGLTQLNLPLSVSGLGSRGMQQLARDLARVGKPFVPYAGSSGSRTGASAAPELEAGDNFAAAVSYGDVTIAAVGTASYVCDGTAVAFGHPATFGGEVTLGANAADALTVVPETFGAPYKLAQIAETIGTLDQDRLAGVRSQIGTTPDAAPIRAVARVPALGRERVGITELVTQDWAATATIAHLWGNFESQFDAFSPGSGVLWWTFEGTRADGSPWKLSHGNRIAAFEYLSAEAAFEIGLELERLQRNPWEEIDVTRVNVSAELERPIRLYELVRVLVSKNGRAFKNVRVVRAKPGTRLRARAVLRPWGGGPLRTVDLPFRIPRHAFPNGFLEVGGAGGGSFFFDEGFFFFEEEERFESFDELLASLQTRQRRDVLSGRLVVGLGGPSVQRVRRVRLPSVVVGERVVRILPQGRAFGRRPAER